ATSPQKNAFQARLVSKICCVFFSILLLQVKSYKEVKDLYILGDTSEVVSNLDDSLVTINTVLSSRYVGGIRGMVDEWRGKLVTLQVRVGA
ncbi:unnamed protein product, partial [Laminaria digitata]